MIMGKLVDSYIETPNSHFVNTLLENVAALLRLQSYILNLRGYVFLTRLYM